MQRRDYRVDMETRAEGKVLWAHKYGTRKEAVDSARDLLAELREADPRAKVWVDGKQVQLKRT